MRSPLLFNPSREADATLDATLAYPALVDELEAAVVADAHAPTMRHWLVVAPRGSGKSHVTELLARRLRARGWGVVRLPEEAYLVRSLPKLLDRIASELDGSTPEPVPTDTTEDRAVDRIRAWCTTRGPVAVVLENVGEMLDRRFTRPEQARFRTLLTDAPPFALVATNTSRPDQITSVKAPFYDFFQERALAELTQEQVAALVKERARVDGATHLLGAWSELTPRIAALYHLSGGNPRLVLALYEVLRAGVDRDLHEQLLALLDEVTPYYQARLHDAPPQGEHLLVELAVADGPLTPTMLAQRTGLKVNEVTANLRHLENQRLARPGGRPQDKRARYWEVTDRLFRVWLHMRESGDARTLRWLVDFYRAWYAGDADGLFSEAERLAGVLDPTALRTALEHLAAAADNDVDRGLIESVRVVVARRAPLEAAWAAGDSQAHGEVALALGWARAEDGDREGALVCLAAARAAADPLADDLEVKVDGPGAAAIFEGWRRGVGLPRTLGGWIQFTARFDDDTILQWASGATVPMILLLTLAMAGRAPLAAQLEVCSVADREYFLGPGQVLARYVAGEPLTADEMAALASFVAESPWLGLAALGAPRNGTTDAELARIEALYLRWPLVQSAVRAARLGRFGAIDTSFPPIDRVAVAAGWQAQPQFRVEAYELLRDAGILPADFPPWSLAARVHHADDPDAELAALHPEVREAVRLILDRRQEPGTVFAAPG